MSIAEVQGAVSTAKNGIDTAEKALGLYNKVVDQVIPWKTFEDTIRDLTSHEKDYSDKAGKLVGDVKTLLLNSRDEYQAATQTVFEWCGVTSRMLAAYLELFKDFEKEKAKAQKGILVKVLGDGVTKLTAAQGSLQKSSKSFNDASGKLSALNTQLTNDFNRDSSYFETQVSKIRTEAYAGAAAGAVAGPFGLLVSYGVAAGVVEGKLIPELIDKLESVKKSFEEITKTVKKADADISSAKDQLKGEISRIGELKTETESTEFFVQYDDLMLKDLKESAGRLIKLCGDYRERHGGKSLV